MAEKLSQESQKETLDKITSDLLKPVGISHSFKTWMGFLIMGLVVCLWAYVIQLKNGLVVTGLRDYISWGMYISNFVFFVAASLVGMLISAVLGLSGAKWISPIARIAEIIAVAFAAVAGLVIISDMGRPDRLFNLFTHGRIQSPIVWDVTVVTVYFLISLILLYLPMIPDLGIAVKYKHKLPKWLVKIYEILSLNWKGTDEQYHLLHKAIRILLVLIVPVALAIHTVTSWLFAVTPRVGWDSTIFGPYFVTGAFVAGVAALIIAMYVFQKAYKLEEYITNDHFNKVGKILVLVSLVYLYFNLNEYLVPAYKMKLHDAHHIVELFQGKHALTFWMVQIFGLVLPIILMLFKKVRKPLPMLIISAFVLVGAWLKRFLIVVPTQEHPFLPIQNVPENFMVYKPTLIEVSVTMASLILVLIIITVLSKFFPVVTMWEAAHERGVEKPESLIEN